jgi:predicted transcriptional regulator
MTNFKRCRQMLGVKQNELARRAGVSPVSIARLDRVGCYDTRTACKYAKHLKCNPVLLLEGLNLC